MSKRPLSPAESALWNRVIATVEPIRQQIPPRNGEGDRPAGVVEGQRLGMRTPSRAATPPSAPLPPPRSGEELKPVTSRTLDGGWDRRLGKGAVQPDVTVDLHGHNLATAYARLDQSLAMAIAAQHRIILLITGKPRKEGEHGGRGAIRAAVADWLASSRHAGQIAAVRNAHPRHGGTGALYIVLRRRG